MMIVSQCIEPSRFDISEIFSFFLRMSYIVAGSTEESSVFFTINYSGSST
jgi:hypothetical protein